MPSDLSLSHGRASAIVGLVLITIAATACGQSPSSQQPVGFPRVAVDTEEATADAGIGVVVETLVETTQAPTGEQVVAGVTAVATPVDRSAPDGPEEANSEVYTRLRQSIMAELTDLNGEWGIGVEDLETSDTLTMNADRQYPAASLYKLVLLAETYQHIEDGALALDQTTRMQESDYSESLMWDEELKIGDKVSVKGLLRVLIIQSSNAAAHALERLMGVTSINETAKRIGLSQTHMPTREIQARYDDWRAETTATSVQDLAHYFGMLYRGQLVSPTASKEMLDLLKQQQINDRIPALLPAGVAVAHKTGNLPGVVADAGIIFGPRADVILVVLNDGADHDPGTEAIGKIARLVFQWHNR